MDGLIFIGILICVAGVFIYLQHKGMIFPQKPEDGDGGHEDRFAQLKAKMEAARKALEDDKKE